jgi:threonine/homoserine/homoserine lactone efflux protein
MSLGPFFIAALALNLAPGPDMTYVVARSLGQGRRAGAISALGIAVGCLVHLAAAAAGVAVVFRAWPEAFTIVRFVGAAYLVYLGIGLIRRASRGADLVVVEEASDSQIFKQGVITNVLNPKVGLFFIAFLPQFVDPARGAAGLQILALGLLFNVSGTLVNLGVAWLSGSVRSLLDSRPRRAWFQRISGAILLGLGVRLALVRSR